MTPAPDFRALCAELVCSVELLLDMRNSVRPMKTTEERLNRARAALATPPPEPLSPAAQAVLDAYWETFNAPLEGAIHRPLAAAIRKLADQLINVKWSVEMWELHQEFHAIATELEGK